MAGGRHLHKAARHVVAGRLTGRTIRVARGAHATRFRTTVHRRVQTADSAGAHRARRVHVAAVPFSTEAGCSVGARYATAAAGIRGSSRARRATSYCCATAATGAAIHGSAAISASRASARTQGTATRCSARRGRSYACGVGRGRLAVAAATGERQRAADDHQQPRHAMSCHLPSMHELVGVNRGRVARALAFTICMSQVRPMSDAHHERFCSWSGLARFSCVMRRDPRARRLGLRCYFCTGFDDPDARGNVGNVLIRGCAAVATCNLGVREGPMQLCTRSHRVYLSRRSKITLAGARPIHPGWLRRSSLTYRRVCALLAPCHPGASAALFAQVIFSRLLIASQQPSGSSLETASQATSGGRAGRNVEGQRYALTDHPRKSFAHTRFPWLPPNSVGARAEPRR